MAINDGGLAFPEAGLSGLPNGEFIQGRSGMSLRDYFAAHAPISPDEVESLFGGMRASLSQFNANMARMRYRYADAMIAAREGRVA